MKPLFAILRLLAGAAIITAIVGQFAKSWSLVPDRAFFFVNFFSYFTILSNALSAIVLLVGAVILFRGRVEPVWFSVAHGSVTTYMATTFVVYNLLLRNISLDQATTVPWSNEILHVWAPLCVVLDWVFAPGRRRITWRQFWVIPAVPLVWAVYTLIRGPIAGWYPYPFLNPANGGYGAVTVYVLAIAAFIGGMGVAVRALSTTRWPYQSDDASQERVAARSSAS